jgi:cytochrome c oxidase cbb3-type subunit 3
MNAALLALGLVAVLCGCEREARRFDKPPHDAAATAAPLRSALEPGPLAADTAPRRAASGAAPQQPPDAHAGNRREDNAWEVAQGKRWFRWYNCNGCHANGGGDSGPPLMDAQWRYGHEPAQIVASILEGRPNGMPTFQGRIPEEQVWQIAAYIRSMSGQLRTDVAPGRSDALSPGEPEQRRDRLELRPAQKPPER